MQRQKHNLLIFIMAVSVVPRLFGDVPLLCQPELVPGYRTAYIDGMNYYHSYREARYRSNVNIPLATQELEQFRRLSEEYCRNRYINPAINSVPNRCRYLQCVMGAQGGLSL